MSDQTQSNNQQVIVYALVAITVLLLAIVGFMVYNQMNNKTASVTAPTAASDTSGVPQMPPAASPVAFDPKTATKLPAGMTPEVALKTYMENVKAGKYPEAYALLPLAQKTSYGSPDSYGSQVKQYGISGYKLGKATSTGTEVSIVSEQDTAAMNITYTWVYTKSGSDWYVKSRTMGGAVTP